MDIAAFVVFPLRSDCVGDRCMVRKRQRDAAVVSAREAKRSADAAEAATAIQQQEHAAELAIQQQEREAARFSFQLTCASGALWQLRNLGTDIAYDVHATIDGEGLLRP
ncbi:hypothetical protein GS528_16985 [Rhodococcus hoagii]|nr:hypothetical protein [Prescottella equi]